MFKSRITLTSSVMWAYEATRAVLRHIYNTIDLEWTQADITASPPREGDYRLVRIKAHVLGVGDIISVVSVSSFLGQKYGTVELTIGENTHKFYYNPTPGRPGPPLERFG